MHSKHVIPALVILAAVSVSTSWAAPNAGTYRSTDMGGPVFTGRITQSEDEGLGNKPGAGDVLGWASWDGSQLGTQWAVTCGVQYAPQVRRDYIDVKGNGTVVLTNTFIGGSFFLSENGPWGGGGPTLGKLTRTDFIVETTYLAFNPVGAAIDVTSRGIDRFGRPVIITSTKCTAWGEVAGRAPENYPELLDMECQVGRNEGYWWDAGDVTILIVRRGSEFSTAPESGDDMVATPDRRTWGSVKTLYR
jgi:hypothetical protein